MKLKCPTCGATFSLDVLLTHDGAREALMTALQMPAPLGKLLVQYLTLFRPATRDLSFDRVNTLLSELLPLIQAGRIERSGREWAAPIPAWQSAIEQMLLARDKLQLPMKSHGYLLEIIAGMGNKAEAVAEEKREENRRHRGQDRPAAGEGKKRSEMPPEVREQLARLTGKMRAESPGQPTSFDHKRNATLAALEAAQGASTEGEK